MSILKKRKSLFVFVVLCLCASLVACGQGVPQGTGQSDGDDETGQQSAEDITLTMWTFLDPNGTDPREVALKQIIDNFEEDNPSITVKVEPQQWDTLGTKFLAAHQSGTAPDIIWLTVADQFGLALEQDAVVDFESLFLGDWSEDEIADVDNVFWNFANKDGKHYQFTISPNYMSIIYREDLLEEKGIEVPFKTWDDFVDAAKKLTEEDPETGIMRYGFGQAFSMDAPNPSIFASALIEEQGDMFTEDGKANWSTDSGIKAMNLQLDMVREHGVTPEEAVSYTIEDLYNDFKSGKYAMITGAGVRIPTLQEEATFDPETIQQTHYPSFDGSSHSPGIVDGWSVGVWSGSEHQEEAGRFVEYMVNKESDEIWVLTGGQAPIRKSTLENNEEILSKPDSKYLGIMSEGFNNFGYIPPWEFPVSGWKSDLNKIAQDVLIGGKDVETAIKDAEAEFNARNGAN